MKLGKLFKCSVTMIPQPKMTMSIVSSPWGGVFSGSNGLISAKHIIKVQLPEVTTVTRGWKEETKNIYIFFGVYWKTGSRGANAGEVCKYGKFPVPYRLLFWDLSLNNAPPQPQLGLWVPLSCPQIEGDSCFLGKDWLFPRTL